MTRFYNYHRIRTCSTLLLFCRVRKRDVHTDFAIVPTLTRHLAPYLCTRASPRDFQFRFYRALYNRSRTFHASLYCQGHRCAIIIIIIYQPFRRFPSSIRIPSSVTAYHARPSYSVIDCIPRSSDQYKITRGRNQWLESHP